ncbi:hypothetical protein AVEN_82323-1 [Araneus ventricosus]|uniref:Uncharacterized protein n=1 Tax=Araneus ventricosus TaxID=182803 RepID=A0A4Y2PPH0_ARAVE|nr:hypothetical protein AVEN_82323-1 [Araneus ventricosus]
MPAEIRTRVINVQDIAFSRPCHILQIHESESAIPSLWSESDSVVPSEDPDPRSRSGVNETTITQKRICSILSQTESCCDLVMCQIRSFGGVGFTDPSPFADPVHGFVPIP